MASAFAHALVAVVAGKVATARKQSFGFWLLGVFCAVIPDADVIAFKFGIPYESMWGHRGITHSLLFALLLALLLTWLFFKQRKPFSRKWWLTTIYFFVCTVSHGVLDAMTTGGKGIAFFAPFDNGRYWLPWREIQRDNSGETPGNQGFQAVPASGSARIRQPLVPPNPKEFDRTRRTRAGRALPTT